MATIWDLAVVHQIPDGEPPFLITRFAVPGGKEGMSATAVQSLEQGAAALMNEGYEPFGGSRDISPMRDNLWFRREVKQPQIPIAGRFRDWLSRARG